MKISKTNILDVTKENVELVKLNLANQIIENVYPLFDEFHKSKELEIEESKEILENKRNLVQKKKEKLESLIKEFNRKKKIKKLLERIDKLVSSGLVYDGSLKKETIVLLKIVEKISEEKIDKHLKETLRTISKRFSQ